MAKITFLFGAGASAQCLPVIKDIPDRLIKFKDFFLSHRSGSSTRLLGGRTEIDVEERFLKECEHIISVLVNKEHATIDTYAKRLRITLSHDKHAVEQYNSLKAIISSFFIYEQLVNKTDNRYDSFFASLLQDDYTGFPKNVRIMSWNYDFQFEKAYSNYCGKSTLSDIQPLLHVHEAGRRGIESDGFGIYKLNGTTALYCKNSTHTTVENLQNDMTKFEEKELVKSFVVLYNCITFLTKEYAPALSFAWEEDWKSQTSDFLDTVQQAIADSEVLVIIGYSFPFFNRSIDRKLIRAISQGLRKIYIQDLNPQPVSTSLLSALPEDYPLTDMLTEISSCEQFFLPPEL